MSSDDQFFRSQLSGRPVSGDADFALNSLKPTMKRARLRRQAAVGAMTVALVGMGGAGVAAVSSSRATPTLQTSSAPAETRSATESSEPSDVATGTNEADDGGRSRGVDTVQADGGPSQSSTAPAPAPLPGAGSRTGGSSLKTSRCLTAQTPCPWPARRARTPFCWTGSRSTMRAILSRTAISSSLPTIPAIATRSRI